MNTNLLLGMVSVAIVACVGEEICSSLGQITYAKWIKVAGTSLAISMGIGAAVTTIAKVKSAFGG
jgi:hypothetical protein